MSLASGLFSPAQAQSEDAPNNIIGLQQTAAAEGTVRVLVSLTPAAGQPSAAGPLDVLAQRALIAEAQSGLVAEIGADAVVHQYENFPVVAMEVTSEELDALLARGDVSRVSRDEDFGPYLAQSTRLIKARLLWQRGITGVGSTVAVLDTGITYRHRAFRGAVAASACFSSNLSTASGDVVSLCRNQVTQDISDRAATECDSSISGCGHGTHTSSTVMGRAPLRGRGVAHSADLIAIQVFSHFPSTYSGCGGTDCARTYYSDQLAAFDYIASISGEHDIIAVSMSLGGGRFYSDCDTYYPEYFTAVQTLNSLGIAVIAASGNNGYSDSIGFPACMSNVIAVGASTDSDNIASFSNQAPGLVDLMAPGVGISAARAWTGRGLISYNGTSMATPHVAGAFALLHDAVPSASINEILTALVCTGRPVSRTAGTDYPRINVYAARRQLLQGSEPGCVE